MFYLLGVAESDSNVQAAVDKVDTFLSLAVCPYGSDEAKVKDDDVEDARQMVDSLAKKIKDEGSSHLFGEGSSANSLNHYCSVYRDYELLCKDLVKPVEQYLGSLSVTDFYTQTTESIEQKMFKENPVEGTVSTDSVDLTAISGPTIYFFTGNGDTTCPDSIANELKESISVKKHYDYGCGTDHMMFTSRGPAQETLIKDMVIALGAETLLAGMVATLTASLALF